MKQIISIFAIVMAMSACQNNGNKNQSELKVRETDSAIKATNPNDAAGSSGRNDTGMTPNQVQTPPATSKSGDSGSSAKKDTSGARK